MNERMYPLPRSTRLGTSSDITSLNTSRSSWTSPNGSRFMMETVSYISTGSADSPARAGGGGLLGNPLEPLDDVLPGAPQREERGRRPQGTSKRVAFVEEGGEVSEEDFVEGRKKGVFGRLKGRLMDGGRQRVRHVGRDSRRAPGMRGGGSEMWESERPRARRYPSEMEMDGELADGFSDEAESDFDADEPISVAELESIVEDDRQAYARAKRRFQSASQHTPIDHAYLQRRLDDMKARERDLELAERDLRKARLQQPSPRPTQQARPSASRQQSARAETFRSYQARPRGNRQPDPSSASFADFNSSTFSPYDPFIFHQRAFDLFAQVFPDFDDDSFSNTHKRSRPSPSSTTRQPPFYPPAGSPDLYAHYNATWLSLPPTSPSIPFPTSTLTSHPLLSPATIPTPLASNCSQETIIETNVQLFFTQALGLEVVLGEEGSVVGVWGERKGELERVLKRERVRWHSDRLGRRGVGGEERERAKWVWDGFMRLGELL